MPDKPTASAISSLADARIALTNLATADALQHLEAALVSMQNLATSLQTGDRLPPAEQRTLEKTLLRFRAELRDASALADQGLAYCQEWTELLQPPPAYQANGSSASTATSRHELSIEA